ncbi:MAG: hypothetical protein HYV27_05740 [Candidatus Hydrogenedentes bacterium]|nr:hypothetical protein [Candidatus Hydrogenedentota bacterium]
MKLRDHFTTLSWLSEAEIQFALALFRKLRRHLVKQGTPNTPLLDLGLIEFVRQDLFIRQLESVILQQAMDPAATPPAELIGYLNVLRTRYLESLERLETGRPAEDNARTADAADRMNADAEHAASVAEAAPLPQAPETTEPSNGMDQEQGRPANGSHPAGVPVPQSLEAPSRQTRAA